MFSQEVFLGNAGFEIIATLSDSIWWNLLRALSQVGEKSFQSWLYSQAYTLTSMQGL